MRKLELLSFILLAMMVSCRPSVVVDNLAISNASVLDTLPSENKFFFKIPINYDVSIDCYFEAMDTLVRHYDSLTPYPLSEHLLVRANSWIIDSLENTDYYRQKERGIFVYNQPQLVILRKGDTLLVPTPERAAILRDEMMHTVIDVNIPEFKLRIIENGDTLSTFLVRVGQNKRKYLSTAGREVDLRTQPGEGQIIRVETDPYFVDPASGKRFTHTRRDDGKTTIMPQIPWLEPELNGQRYGQLIHPTTNPKTLGKAYSNGCVGTGEADAWRIYYYAPIGTQVVFRYDLLRDSLSLKDIYGFGHKPVRAAMNFKRSEAVLRTMKHEFGCPF